jgi:hypothetical protein
MVPHDRIFPSSLTLKNKHTHIIYTANRSGRVYGGTNCLHLLKHLGCGMNPTRGMDVYLFRLCCHGCM